MYFCVLFFYVFLYLFLRVLFFGFDIIILFLLLSVPFVLVHHSAFFDITNQQPLNSPHLNEEGIVTSASTIFTIQFIIVYR